MTIIRKQEQRENDNTTKRPPDIERANFSFIISLAPLYCHFFAYFRQWWTIVLEHCHHSSFIYLKLFSRDIIYRFTPRIKFFKIIRLIKIKVDYNAILMNCCHRASHHAKENKILPSFGWALSKSCLMGQKIISDNCEHCRNKSCTWLKEHVDVMTNFLQACSTRELREWEGESLYFRVKMQKVILCELQLYHHIIFRLLFPPSNNFFLSTTTLQLNSVERNRWVFSLLYFNLALRLHQASSSFTCGMAWCGRCASSFIDFFPISLL